MRTTGVTKIVALGPYDGGDYAYVQDLGNGQLMLSTFCDDEGDTEAAATIYFNVADAKRLLALLDRAIEREESVNGLLHRS